MNYSREKSLFRRAAWWLLCFALAAPLAPAGQSATRPAFNVLDQFSDSVQAVVARVAPSVVQIVVTRYAPSEEGRTGRAGLVLDREQTIGSGVIVDPAGYIVTNAHVVADAVRIKVILARGAAASGKAGESVADALEQPFAAPVNAVLAGTFKEADLAVLKINATGLTPLPFADYAKLRAGQVVFAFGSRAGLQNSVSMGVVSSVARQPEADSPFIYIQTDAPINPGDSGGPLVNTAGELVGLDTFILSRSGGNEGIGFAIPSPLVEIVSRELKEHGRFNRQVIGAGVQTITPVLAAALKLPRQSGVVVSDLFPGGPGEAGGLKLKDVVLTMDGDEVPNLPAFLMTALTHRRGEPLKMTVLREGQAVSLDLAPTEESHASDRLTGHIDVPQCQIAELGIVGVAIDQANEEMFSDIRGKYGIYVAARLPLSGGAAIDLQAGDVIHEINDVTAGSVEAARDAMGKLKAGDPVALFIERDGRLLYVTFEME